MKSIPTIRVKKWLKSLKTFSLNKFSLRKIPYSAQIEVTLRCNASCDFCSIPALPKSVVINEMNTNQIKLIIDQDNWTYQIEDDYVLKPTSKIKNWQLRKKYSC